MVCTSFLDKSNFKGFEMPVAHIKLNQLQSNYKKQILLLNSKTMRNSNQFENNFPRRKNKEHMFNRRLKKSNIGIHRNNPELLKLKILRRNTKEQTTNSAEDSTTIMNEEFTETSTTTCKNSSHNELPQTNINVSTAFIQLLDNSEFQLADLKASSNIDDIEVNHGINCDKSTSQLCWYERGVGETLTLNVNITGYTDLNAFIVRWKKVYHQRDKKTGISIKIEQEKLPWNMVLGSGGRELRLNPVSNSDIDPNSISANVFLADSKNKRKAHILIKELIFRIEIPSIDIGKVYYGEELSIYIENFITLPENGNLFLQWNMEKAESQKESLPSNAKISSSRRSIVIKELRKGQLGVISCVIYSSNNIAVAKRRFNILKLDNLINKRSLKRKNSRRRMNYKRHPYTKCEIENSRLKQFAEYMKPISRKKRFRMNRLFYKDGERCPFLHVRQRLHPRWALFDFPDTTLDPRLISIEKLIALSEESDGTLDDIIPHEVHFVKPIVTVVTDSILEYVKTADFTPNCTTDLECGVGAYCIVANGQEYAGVDKAVMKGYCYCRPEYFGDGFNCKKIPMDNHRDKRIKRSASNVEPVVRSLFYSGQDYSKNVIPLTELETENTPLSQEENEMPKTVEFEEEESYLLSTCSDKKDCSPHAICYQFHLRGHPFCKCISGYRGNGIFCWEIIDFVPVNVLDIDISQSNNKE